MNEMKQLELIPLELFCSITHVETTLIDALAESGLVVITVQQEQRFIPVEELERLEKLVRLHEDLGINVAGLEAIEHLLHRLESLHEEMRDLRNRLRLYEME